MADRCTGECCRHFSLSAWGSTPDEIRTNLRAVGGEGYLIADMLVPVRHLQPGDAAPSGNIVDDPGGQWLLSCKHFDAATGNCGIYDTRPSMCRDYPYGKPCQFAACEWERGRAGAWPPARVHREGGRVHLYVLAAVAPSPTTVDDLSQGHTTPA